MKIRLILCSHFIWVFHSVFTIDETLNASSPQWNAQVSFLIQPIKCNTFGVKSTEAAIYSTKNRRNDGNDDCTSLEMGAHANAFYVDDDDESVAESIDCNADGTDEAPDFNWVFHVFCSPFSILYFVRLLIVFFSDFFLCCRFFRRTKLKNISSISIGAPVASQLFILSFSLLLTVLANDKQITTQLFPLLCLLNFEIVCTRTRFTASTMDCFAVFFSRSHLTNFI